MKLKEPMGITNDQSPDESLVNLVQLKKMIWHGYATDLTLKRVQAKPKDFKNFHVDKVTKLIYIKVNGCAFDGFTIPEYIGRFTNNIYEWIYLESDQPAW